MINLQKYIGMEIGQAVDATWTDGFLHCIENQDGRVFLIPKEKNSKIVLLSVEKCRIVNARFRENVEGDSKDNDC